MPRSSHSNPKASSSHVTPSNPNPETSTSPAGTAIAAGVGEAIQAPPPTPLDARIAAILVQLDAIESSLDLDIVVRPNDKAQMRAVARISDTALFLASDLVSSAPDQFAPFHELPGSTSYVRSMTKLALRASALAAHIQKSVLNQRTPAAIQTLALYGVVKSLGRIPTSEAMREKVAALKEEVAPKRKLTKPRVTKAEKAARRAADSKAKKLEAARKLLAAEQPPTPEPAPVNGAPPAPPAGGPTPASNVVPLDGAAGAAH